MSVNKVILIGNLGRDPEIKTGTNFKIAKLNLATTYKSKDEEQTEWHYITLFDKLAEIAEKYAKKGSKIYIEGRIKTETYLNKDKVQVQSKVIIGNVLQLVGSKNEPTAHAPFDANQTLSPDLSTPFKTMRFLSKIRRNLLK